MSQQGNRLRGTTLRLLMVLLPLIMLFGGCRIRRERPKSEPAPPSSAAPLSSAAASGAMASAATPPPPAAPPSVPVPAPQGVLVMAVTSATLGTGSIESALASVRAATRRLLDGDSGIAVTASGLIPFERALDVPVASGAPLRRNGERPQCDVVLIDSLGRSFGVGAVADLESPARLALEVYERGWGFVVGEGARKLAKEVGIASLRWSPEIEQQQSAGSDAGADVGTIEPRTGADDIVAVVHDHERGDAGVKGSDTAAGTADVTAARASMAVLILRDRDGRFFVAAEECGNQGAPVGQLTALVRADATAFVGEEGAVFVAGDRDLAVDARHAERIYRRLAVLQVPKAAADWGLKTSEGATVVIIVSRLGSGIASSSPIVWARNHSDGESSAQLPTNRDEQPETALSATEHSSAEERPDAEPEPLSQAGAPPTLETNPTTPPAQASHPIDSATVKAASQSGGAPGSDGSAGGRSPSLHNAPEAAVTPKPVSSAARTSDKDAGQP